MKRPDGTLEAFLSGAWFEPFKQPTGGVRMIPDGVGRSHFTHATGETVMGIFERVLQEQEPATHSLTLTARQAFAALVLAALNSDGRGGPEETLRINGIFSSTRLFRQPSAEPAQAVLEQVLELFDVHGFGPVVTAAAKALPQELRAPAFTMAVDLVMADGQATGSERKFIDGLQALLQLPDETAMKIVEVIIIKNSV